MASDAVPGQTRPDPYRSSNFVTSVTGFHKLDLCYLPGVNELAVNGNASVECMIVNIANK